MHDSGSSTYPRKLPSQARSRDLVDAMLTATARVLCEEGADALTTNRIAEVAGVSIGSLYQYFPGKEALLAGVLERELERDVVVIQDMLVPDTDLTLELLVTSCVDALLEHGAQRAQLHSLLLPLVGVLEREALVASARAGLDQIFAQAMHACESQWPDAWHDPHVRQRTWRMARAGLEAAFNALKVHHPEELGLPDVRRTLVQMTRSALGL